jgi:hypothetical protein
MAERFRSGATPLLPKESKGLRMQSVYYNRMRNLPVVLLVALAVPCVRAQQSQSPPMRTSIIESHEGLTVGVDPWTTSSRYRGKFKKVTPFSGGVVAIRVSFRNNTDESIKVDLSRIRLTVILGEDENRQELTPLGADDVADAVLFKSPKDPTARRNPLPIPVGKSRGGRDKNWTEFRDDCQNAAVPSSVIAAHGSLEGLVYFDIRGEVDLLQTAHFYVPNLVTMSTNQPLSYFDIDMNRSGSNN